MRVIARSALFFVGRIGLIIKSSLATSTTIGGQSCSVALVFLF